MDVFMKIIILLSLLLASEAWASWSASSYNIRNFDRDSSEGRTNLTELGKTIKAFKSDVMTFVEVVNLKAFKELVQVNLPEHVIVSSTCGGSGKQKLAIVYNPKVFDFIEQRKDMTFSGATAGCGSLRSVLLVTLKLKAQRKNTSLLPFILRPVGPLPP